MVTNISNGYTSLKGVDFKEGFKSFEVRASSATSGGLWKSVLTARQVLCGKLLSYRTGGWQNGKPYL